MLLASPLTSAETLLFMYLCVLCFPWKTDVSVHFGVIKLTVHTVILVRHSITFCDFLTEWEWTQFGEFIK
jgi:hypothetical protein